MKTGIYTITNIVNNKIYVGSTVVKFSTRKSQHLSKLRNNTHANRYLQYSFNKYGEDTFKFEVLEECSKEFCLSQEQYWINMLNVCNRKHGYNINPTSSNCAGRKLSDEHKNKIRIKNIGRKRSKESIEKMKKAKKGIVFSEIQRKNMSLAQLGRKLSSEQLIKRSFEIKKRYRDNPEYGLIWKKPIYKLDKNNNVLKEYNSISEASQKENLNLNAISHCLTGRSKTCGGFIWKYKNKKEEVSIG